MFEGNIMLFRNCRETDKKENHSPKETEILITNYKMVMSSQRPRITVGIPLRIYAVIPNTDRQSGI